MNEIECPHCGHLLDQEEVAEHHVTYWGEDGCYVAGDYGNQTHCDIVKITKY